MRKIAILGGGISSLSAAFDLTSEKHWKKRYEITVYQLGWRLGGKGASSRNPAYSNRIEEHGLHVWLGFYENAFAMIRQCYRENASRSGTFRSWEDAFKPHNYVVLEEKTAAGWMGWPIEIPSNDSVPGDGQELPTLWDYVIMALQWIRELLEPRPVMSNANTEGMVVTTTSTVAINKELSSRERSNPRIDLKLARTAERRARRMPRDSRKHKDEDRDVLLSLSGDLSKLMVGSVPMEIDTDPELRRIWITIDLFATAIRGVLRDQVLGYGLDCLDDVDFRGWLIKHGAAELTVNSAFLRAYYDLAFSFENGDRTKMNLAAGAAIRALFRMVFTYKRAFLWKMQAGMGETVFAPLYQVLKSRGVQFRFFRCVDSLELSDAGTDIAKILMTRQATCRQGEYEPLVRVNGLDCWHHGPDFDQLVEGQTLKQRCINLESYWTPWPGVDQIILNKGTDFDTIILGIPIAGLKEICRSLVEKSSKWRSMLDRVKTVQTQAFQLWLTKDLSECGWKLPSPILGAYVEPLDTWADMSHLLAVEEWAHPVNPKQIAYFCGVMETCDELAPRNDLSVPSAQSEKCKAAAIDYLNRDSAHFWPTTSVKSNPPTFDWSCLASTSGANEVARFDSQYWRANIDPSERYVQAVAGSTRFRLKSDGSGFSNLILAGDWIRNGFNSPGCIESAVISGKQAARVVSGSNAKIIGESDFTHAHGFASWVREKIQNLIDVVFLLTDRWMH